MKKSFLICLLLAGSQSAFAFNFHELSVYGYDTADPHEAEFENSSSVSSNDIMRSSFELNYGLTDKIELGGYLDYQKSDTAKMNLDSVRLRARTSLYKRGEMPVDMGLYVETEIPQDSDESYTVDTKLILQKEIGRWTYVLSPGLEYVKLKEANENGNTSEIEKHYNAMIMYNYSDRIKPHVDIFGEVNDDPTRLLMLGLDFTVRHGFNIAAGVGTTNRSENLILTKLEFEVY